MAKLHEMKDPEKERTERVWSRIYKVFSKNHEKY